MQFPSSYEFNEWWSFEIQLALISIRQLSPADCGHFDFQETKILIPWIKANELKTSFHDLIIRVYILKHCLACVSILMQMYWMLLALTAIVSSVKTTTRNTGDKFNSLILVIFINRLLVKRLIMLSGGFCHQLTNTGSHSFQS